MKSTYVLQLDDSSFCPCCGKPVRLLCREDGKNGEGAPWFYICFDCQEVAEVGEGKVWSIEAQK